MTVPTTDARYAATRARIDKSWEMYKAGVQLGALADKKLSLVLVNDPSVNAFVMPTATPGVGYFAVAVNTGLVDAPSMTEATTVRPLPDRRSSRGLLARVARPPGFSGYRARIHPRGPQGGSVGADARRAAAPDLLVAHRFFLRTTSIATSPCNTERHDSRTFVR